MIPLTKRCDELQENYQKVREEIAEAALAAGRAPADVHLIAVSKTYPAEDLALVHSFGQDDFGENRVQELLPKITALSAEVRPIRWHLIGTLQTNKVRFVAGQVALIHSVHETAVLRELERRLAKKGGEQAVLLQLNIAEEESKHGFRVEELPQALETLSACPHLRLHGLMCMAPFFENAADAYPVFARCAELFQKLREQYPEAPLDTLSMGMSHDFREAIRAGATHVRIGTAIFGARDYTRA